MPELFTLIVSEAARIAHFVAESILHIWPVLLLTVPLVWFLRQTQAGRWLKAAMGQKPVVSVLLAALLGSLSPLCSCSVIPVIAALLQGGVALGPVMAFWLASPSMDPEIFFLSVGALGWELAWWRLAGSFVLSLGGGYLALGLQKQGWLGPSVLSPALLARQKAAAAEARRARLRSSGLAPGGLAAGETPSPEASRAVGSDQAEPPARENRIAGTDGVHRGGPPAGADRPAGSWVGRLLRLWRHPRVRDLFEGFWLVLRFMILAYTLEALVKFYLPQELVSSWLGGEDFGAVAKGALVGLPLYITNLSALGLVGGLLAKGWGGGAALAFLFSGAVTTVPALTAVWGVASRRVFALYVVWTLLGALALGSLYTALRLSGILGA